MNDAGPVLRRATEADVAAVAQFQTDCWREAYAGLVPSAYLDRVGVAEREARWRDRIVVGSRQVALAERRGRVVGVVSWSSSDEAGASGLELMSLYVDRLCRGSGLGRALLDLALGDRAASLWVFEANLAARAFYGRAGFVVDGGCRTDPDTGLREVRMTRDVVSRRPRSPPR